MFLKFGKFQRKTLVLESLFNKLAGLRPPTWVLSYEICQNFKNTSFEEHLQTTASMNK